MEYGLSLYERMIMGTRGLSVKYQNIRLFGRNSQNSYHYVQILKKVIEK